MIAILRPPRGGGLIYAALSGRVESHSVRLGVAALGFSKSTYPESRGLKQLDDRATR